jgi:sugar-specific transcriptional regulator TrmB
MMDDVKIALAELGLAAKEADTYLAMLELGPASVQDIAKKAGINRTTTYVMIEGLKKHGLVSTFERGKKTLFSAENPEQLLDILTKETSVINAKKSKPRCRACSPFSTRWKTSPRSVFWKAKLPCAKS